MAKIYFLRFTKIVKIHFERVFLNGLAAHGGLTPRHDVTRGVEHARERDGGVGEDRAAELQGGRQRAQRVARDARQ